MAENQSAVEIVEEAKVMNVSRPWEDAPGGSIFREERRVEDQVEGGKERQVVGGISKERKKRREKKRRKKKALERVEAEAKERGMGWTKGMSG